MGLMSKAPWWVKIGLKLVLSKLPLPYTFWKKVGLFRHGNMDDPNRAIRTFERYYQKALTYKDLVPGFTSLELGPGDSILSGVAAHAYGAKRAWLVDAGSFADTNLKTLHAVVHELRNQGRDIPPIDNALVVEDAIRLLGIEYLTEGTTSLNQIPEASIDFFWSQVVLEHIPRDEFPEFLKHLRRVAKPDAIGVHSIDFRDHLSGNLNNLRFSGKRWESDLFRNARFYTNRIRPYEMILMFSEAGFSVELLAEERWSEMPIKRQNLASEFQKFSDDEFMVKEIEVLLRPCHK